MFLAFYFEYNHSLQFSDFPVFWGFGQGVDILEEALYLY